MKPISTRRQQPELCEEPRDQPAGGTKAGAGWVIMRSSLIGLRDRADSMKFIPDRPTIKLGLEISHYGVILGGAFEAFLPI